MSLGVFWEERLAHRDPALSTPTDKSPRLLRNVAPDRNTAPPRAGKAPSLRLKVSIQAAPSKIVTDSNVLTNKVIANQRVKIFHNVCGLACGLTGPNNQVSLTSPTFVRPGSLVRVPSNGKISWVLGSQGLRNPPPSTNKQSNTLKKKNPEEERPQRSRTCWQLFAFESFSI